MVGAGDHEGGLRVLAVADDPIDGIIRMLADTQRFGLTLRCLSVTPHCTTSMLITLDLVGHGGDGMVHAGLAERLARHPSLHSVVLCPTQGRLA